MIIQEPLYKKGDDKDKILDIYKNAPDMQATLSKISKAFKNCIFGEDAKKEYLSRRNG